MIQALAEAPVQAPEFIICKKRRMSESVYWDSRSERWGVRFYDVSGTRPVWRLCPEGTKKADAKKTLADRQRQVEEARRKGFKSVYELIRPEPAPAPLTLKKFSAEYLKLKKSMLVTKTYERYEEILEGHVYDALGAFALVEVTPGQLERYSSKRLGDGASPATVKQELVVISGVFKLAEKMEHVTRNPVRLTDKPKVENVIVRWLNVDEEKALLGKATEPLSYVIPLAIDTGLREGEIVNLTWANVNLDRKEITVRKTKAKKDRVVPMSARAFDVLSKLKKLYDENEIETPFVFVSPKTGTKYDRFNNTPWRKALKDAGIQNFRFHDLRHTFCSRLAQRGVPLITIAELAGHSSIQVTMRYAHLAPSNKTNAVAELDLYRGAV